MQRMSYAEWFEQVAGHTPHPWQAQLGGQSTLGNRLIRIPTGFGKTRGVLLAWAHHRVVRQDDAWPRRLVWCLPMRVLVEQTVAEAQAVLGKLGVLWSAGERAGRVGVHTLMGGADAGEWHVYPEDCAVLIGTQDMLLSRALNRGYGAARARWPIDFGLLNHDCLWVMDEVQLMDVGLATSAQLQAFRDMGGGARPATTWWMSATLQQSWLRRRDTEGLVDATEATSIPPEDRRGPLWDVHKPMELRRDAAEPRALAAFVTSAHTQDRAADAGPTLIVVNTVGRAVEIAQQLRANKALAATTEIRLIHSRFRPAERRHWRTAFLNREACAPGTNRIIVATQVVEAGVDVSASLLVTDLAPWPSLVQRFGRAARWGGQGRVVVVDTEPKDDGAALPYSKDELDASRAALEELTDVAPLALEQWETVLPEARIRQLYPYEPEHLVLRHEVDELFDTTPDLSGADIDVSRFIRSGQERDLQVFWANLTANARPDENMRPSREALCAVPFLDARKWLCGKGRRLETRGSAWIWSWLDGQWREAEARDLYPGQTVLVDAKLGGYDWDPAVQFGLGWSPRAKRPVPPVEPAVPAADQRADAAQDDESLSATPYRTIATHGAETGELAAELAARLAPAQTSLLRLAGQFHDVGKAHEAFQGSMRADDRPNRRDLAKAPPRAWSRKWLYQPETGARRPGFRHELASALSLFGILARHDPTHDALLGPWTDLLAAMGDAMPAESTGSLPVPLERAVLDLDAESFDLLAYLVASHHGKVRVSWHASPADQDAAAAAGRLTLRGIRDGDELPSLLAPPDGATSLPTTTLDLSPSAMGVSARTGASWTDRVLALVARHGPFQLAWLEALLRAADQRASRIATADPLLAKESP